MNLRATSFVLLFLSSIMIAGCADTERAAIEEYFATAEPIGTELSEVGAKFETLMNVQENPFSWSEAQKTEIRAISEGVSGLRRRVEAMAVPALLTEAHPLLVQTITEMDEVIRVVLDVAEQPETAEEKMNDAFVAKATRGEELADKYAQKLDEALAEKYPELLEEEMGE